MSFRTPPRVQTVSLCVFLLSSSAPLSPTAYVPLIQPQVGANKKQAVIQKDTDDGIPGYETEILATEVEVSPGQFQIFHGTVEEVHAQALKMNPHFKLNALPTKKVEARVPHNQIFCDRYDYASSSRIEEGISYLRRVPGQPHNGPGPGKCSRVSCSYDSAIWWCNDVRAASFCINKSSSGDANGKC